MSLTSLSFIGIYFPLMLIAYYNPFFKDNIFRKIILVCASLGLYAFSEPMYILLLMFMILYNYGLVKIADKTGNKIFRIIAIVLDALILLTFKYINVFLSFGLIGDTISELAFPIGLSYFTFKAISYVADSSTEKEGNIIDVAIYISNFLTIVSGPLSTYADELSYIRNKRTLPESKSFYRGLERLTIGLGKKVIIADSLGNLVSTCFASAELSIVMAWAGAVGYTLQLFFDFSGYTDMAIGVGYLFGFDLPENFNYPYMAHSISDFWKRWHISLTKWFTKYIYFPLGGSRVKSSGRHIFNLFVVWLVTGIWHGSTMTFIIWALIYFVLQLIEKYSSWENTLKKLHIGHFYTLFIVILEWVIFRSSSMPSAWLYIKAMFGLGDHKFLGSGDLDTILVYTIPLLSGIIFSTNIGARLGCRMKHGTYTNIIYNIAITALFMLCIILIIAKGYSAPLYAGF